MLNSFLQTLLTLTIAGTLLALLMFALKPLLRGRVSSTFQYYLWLIVLLRLVVPIGSPVSVSNIFTVSTPSIAQTETVTRTPNFVATETQTAQNTHTQTPQNAPQTSQNAQNIGTPIPATIPQQNIDFAQYVPQIIFLLWLLGATVYFTLHLIGYLKFVTKLKKSNEKPDAADVQLCEKMGNGKVMLLLNAEISTSILIGVFRPRIVVPKAQYVNSGAESELSNILRHELTHYRRCDLLYKWFLLIVCATQWFNPVMYFVKKEISAQCELACDEAVIADMTAMERQSYGQTLISAVRGKLPSAVLTTAMCARRTQIKERLINIMKFKKRSVLTTIICTILAIALTGCAAMLGTPANETVVTEFVNETALNEALAVQNPIEINDEEKQPETDWGEFVTPAAKINETIEVDGVKIVFDGDVIVPQATFSTAAITKKELTNTMIYDFYKEVTGETLTYSKYDRDVEQVKKMYNNWLNLSEKGIMTGNSVPSWKYSEIANPRVRTAEGLDDYNENRKTLLIPNNDNVSLITRDFDYNHFYYMRDEFDIIQPKSMTDTLRVGKDDSKPQIDFLTPGVPNISQNDAQKTAEKHLAMFGLDYSPLSVEPCTIIDNVLEKTTGWYMIYTRNLGGLQSINFNDGFGVDPSSVTAGSPPWGSEKCVIAVDKSGLVYFSIAGISNVDVAEPATIMPFDMIKQKIAEHLVDSIRGALEPITEITVKSISLCTAGISKVDKVTGQYVPAWYIISDLWGGENTFFIDARTGDYIEPRMNLDADKYLMAN